MSITPDVARAAKLSSLLTLRAVTFQVIEGRVLAEADPGAALAWALEPFTVSWERVGREMRVVLPFDIRVTDRQGRKCWTMHVTMRTLYDVPADVEVPAADDLDHHAGISAVLHAWPYLRAELQSLSMKLGMVSPVVLPNILATQLPDTVDVRRAKKAVPRKSAKRGAKATRSSP